MSSLIQERHERFLRLLEPFRVGFGRFCRAISSDRELARDLASEAILIVYEHIDSLRDESKFKSYLYTTAARLNKRQKHRERNRAPYDATQAETIRDNGTEADSRHDIELLHSMLSRLPEAQREAVILFEISGLSLEEIRNIQGGSLSGVKSRISRGRELLTKMMSDNEQPLSAPSHLSSNGSATGSNFVYARTSLKQDTKTFPIDRFTS